MRTFLLLLALTLAIYNVYNVATLKTPLTLTVRPTVGLAPVTIQLRVRAPEGGQVCVVVEGPESMQSCRVLDGVTWWVDYTLRAGGDYVVYAMNERYRTPAQSVRVVGMEGEQP